MQKRGGIARAQGSGKTLITQLLLLLQVLLQWQQPHPLVLQLPLPVLLQQVPQLVFLQFMQLPLLLELQHLIIHHQLTRLLHQQAIHQHL